MSQFFRHLLLYVIFGLFLAVQPGWGPAVQAQNFPYSIVLESFTIPGLPGMHSFASAHYNGKWLILGGRVDGMHRGGGGPNNPAFPSTQRNMNIYVVDPVAQQVWSAPLSSLSTALQDQLSSTNQEYYQDGDWLYIAGGYGYSVAAGDHVTYDELTAVNVPGLINDIINGNPIAGNFLQTSHAGMQSTGGALGKIGNTFYLFGGIDFQGRYIMGGMGGAATVYMQYTDQIRTFEIVNTGTSLSVTNYSAMTNAAEFHRRDFNLVPQIFPGNQYGYMWSSGVFKAPNDEVYFNPIEITASGVTIIPESTFSQQFSNYHSAKMALYDPSSGDMHSIFFGGIAQFYYDANGNLVEDTNVPFVKTISLVTRDANGVYTESVFSTEMPTYVGAGAKFFLSDSIAEYAKGIVDMSQLPATGTFTVGYIFGGIESPVPNTFPSNTGVTSASNTIYRVLFVNNIMSAELADLGAVPGNARCIEGDVVLQWKTLSETNTKEFVIERGQYGNFEAIGSVPAAGNTTEPRHYRFTDEDPLPGRMYYRLKVVDYDGTFNYSDVISVVSCNGPAVQLMPNPTSGTVQVRVEPDFVGDFPFRLLDASGKEVELRVSRANGGWVLDMFDLPKGVYYLQDRAGNAHRIVKQ